jgi:hypothetical protein
VAIDVDEFVVEVAAERARLTLRVEQFPIVSGFDEHNSGLIRSSLRTVDVSIDACCVVLIVLSIP